MAPMDDDNESHNSDEDEVMEDAEEEDANAADGGEGEAENEEENDDNDEDDDNDDNLDDTPTRSRPRPSQPGQHQHPPSPLDGRRHVDRRDPAGRGLQLDQDIQFEPRGAAPATPTGYRPAIRFDALGAATYDIVPTIAAPHSTSINAIAATPDMRWVFSGGSDGYVRKFNWVDTANFKSMLTVAQRHPFVDSVTKAGVLMSYWENEDILDKSAGADEGTPLSPVYSLAVHHQALWLLSGTESGPINMMSVRHEEGKRITSLQKHTSAVSVMVLSNDEQSVLSGSWDKTILDWDLNTGQIKRSFTGIGGQISSIEMRPLSHLPVPRKISDPPPAAVNGTFSVTLEPKPLQFHDMKADFKEENPQKSPSDSLFGDNEDHDSLFGDDDGNGKELGINPEDDDAFAKALTEGFQQPQPAQESLQLPQLDENGDFNMDESTFLTNGTDFPDLEADQAFFSQNELPELPSDLITNGINDLPHAEALVEVPKPAAAEDDTSELPPQSESTFLDASMDGSIRIWDRRAPNPVARITPARSVPPWCMHACWSPDGNFIYAGRRNCTVDEYSLHRGFSQPRRSLRFPGGSGAVSAMRAMPNGRHLLCASHDILRLYDLRDEESAKPSTVPFLIVPGHRTGVISQLYLDPTCTFLISTGGNRGWEGNSTEVLLGYEIGFGH